MIIRITLQATPRGEPLWWRPAQIGSTQRGPSKARASEPRRSHSRPSVFRTGFYFLRNIGFSSFLLKTGLCVILVVRCMTADCLVL